MVCRVLARQNTHEHVKGVMIWGPSAAPPSGHDLTERIVITYKCTDAMVYPQTASHGGALCSVSYQRLCQECKPAVK